MMLAGSRIAVLLVLLGASIWLLLTFNRVPTAPEDPGAAVDRIVFEHPAYVITAERSGTVHVRFPLNEQDVPREQILRRWPVYPADTLRELMIPEQQRDELFALATTGRLHAVRGDYLAPAAEGEEPIAMYRLTTYAGDLLLKRVTFDEAKRSEWPRPLAALTVAVVRAGTRDGEQLPLMPAPE